MTKAQIAERAHERMDGLSKKDATDAVECVFEMLKEAAEQGREVKIAGFRKLVVRAKKSRTGRDPRTGKEIAIGARRVLKFRPSPLLKGVLNGVS